MGAPFSARHVVADLQVGSFCFSRVSEYQPKGWPLQRPPEITSLKAGHYKIG
jgi:hypothetical protein